MSEPIKVGDLAWIAKTKSCCGGGNVGVVVQVLAIDAVPKPTKCADCGRVEKILCARTGESEFTKLTRLKRIPPLSELEGQKTQEPVVDFKKRMNDLMDYCQKVSK